MELVATKIPDLPLDELNSMLEKQIEGNEVNRIMGITNKDCLLYTSDAADE